MYFDSFIKTVRSWIKILSAVLTFFLVGCQTMEVNNNKFISTRRPYLEAKISNEFKYLSHFEFKENRLNINKTKTHRIESDYFTFIPNATTSGLLQKYIYIRLEKNLDSFFINPFFATSKKYFDWSQKKLGWYEYELASEIAFPNKETDKQLQKLIEEGFIMPEGVIKRMAARVVGTNKVMIIVYGEDAALSGFKYDLWRDRAKLTEEQIKYVSDFNQRASTMFEIIASD